MGFDAWVSKAWEIIKDGDWKTTLSLIVSLLIGFWMIPISFAVDTDNGKLTYVLHLVYGLIFWVFILYGVTQWVC